MSQMDKPPAPDSALPESSRQRAPIVPLPANARLFLALLVTLVTLFELLRLGLILRVRTPDLATWGELGRSFLVGLRFDVSSACLVLIPVVVLSYIPWTSPWRGPQARRIFLWTLTAVFSFIALLLVAEFEFFREFQTRYNQLALRYLDHPEIVGGMVWYNYPVVRYILAWLLGAAFIHLALRWDLRWAAKAVLPAASAKRNLAHAAGAIFIVVFTVIGLRGGVQAEPLRWGDAFHGNNEFANQMSLNGIGCLTQTIRETFVRGERSSGWAGHMPMNEARQVVRGMLVAPTDKLLDPDHRTVLRASDPHSTLSLRAADGKPLNVVVVMMESFSARYCGAAGAPRSFTPEFDALAKEGILFDHCFSAGSHTHQGIFGTLLAFPNLPGYETLMQSGAGNQHFLSLPEIFHSRGYNTFFLYNGNFAWDNMRGFFRKQGVDTFIGGDEMTADAKFRDHVWGVSDGDLFDRCNREFEAASQKGPFMAAIMTLSNHAPFEVPPVPGAAPITDMGDTNKRLEAMRYADWSVGHFIAEARKLSYFNNTLFVFVGDHGFAVQPVLTEVHLLYHHVPLLFFAPGLTDRRGVDHRVATHMNIIPSVVGVLGLPQVEQASWGHNLFDDSFPDENFAVFKMTGGGKSVALARGNNLLVFRDAKAEPQLYSYTLWPPAVTPATDAASASLKKQLARELKAYVQCALTDLTDHKAGPMKDSGK